MGVKIRNSTNNEKITQCTQKSVVLSIALVRRGTNLPVVREITLIKRYNFIINERLVTRDGRTGLRNHFMSN